jgi:hypothetical protein
MPPKIKLMFTPQNPPKKLRDMQTLINMHLAKYNDNMTSEMLMHACLSKGSDN